MNWNENRLKALLNELQRYGGDTTEIEVKRGSGGVPSLGESLSAFGNMPDGGVIIIGVAEPGFAVTGVEDPAAIAQGIAAQARNGLNPPVTTQFYGVGIEGKKVVICEVAGLPLPARPCEFEGVAYLRQVDGDYRMSDVELQMIEDRKRQAALGGVGWLSPDSQLIPGTSVDDLDDAIVDTVLSNFRKSHPRNREHSDEELLYNLGVAGKSGEISVAGIYVMGKFPQRFVPSWGAIAAVQLDGEGGARNRDLQHIEGPVPGMFEQLMDWSYRNITSDIVYREDGNAIDVPSLPRVAMRELFANALVHRDLSTLSRGSSVNVRLKNRHLVVTNPGGLIGITSDQLGDQNAQRPVNEHVYRLCQHFRFDDGTRLIEGEGGGIRWVRRELKDADLRPPKFYDKGVSFTAMISEESLIGAADLKWLAGVTPEGDLSRVQRNILVQMYHGKEWSNADVRDSFEIDSVQARAELQDLVVRGLAEVDGTGRMTTYVLQREPNSSEAMPTENENKPAESNKISNNGVLHGGTLLALLAGGYSKTVRELRAATGLSERQVRYALDLLEQHGQIRKISGRPAKWVLS